MFLLLVGRAVAATWTVGPSGDYDTVAEAEAVAISGDTIVLAAGVYTSTLAPGARDLTYATSGGASVRAGDTCLAVEAGTRITVEGLTFAGCTITVAGGRLDAHDVVFSGTTCTSGCAITASGAATVTVTGGRFVDNAATGDGGSIAARSGASITLTDTTFSGGSAARGGAIAFASDGALTLDGVTITGASAEEGGGIWATGGALDLVGVTFVENLASGAGGGAYVAGGTTRVDGARFLSNVAGGSGGGLAGEGATLEVTTSAFLGNSAGGGGGGLYSADASVWIAGSVLLENDAAGVGGGVYVDAPSFEAENVSLACNSATSGGGVYVSASDTVVTASLATANVGSGLVIYTGGFTATDNLSWGNTGDEWGGVTDPTRTHGNLWLNPRVRALACDGDWTTDDLAPGASSALVGGADPLVDVDGSTGDIGGYGGTWGAALDVDADGATYWAGDCHEGRADAHPGAPEAWYDGTDQDCDGNDDDQDVDGYSLVEDCDDTDAGVSPGAAEAWYDGTDQDCDGNDDDQDVDGYALAEDCADTVAAVNPGATEAWYDGTDQDCDGNDLDQDLDGYDLAEDCADTDAAVNPGAVEAWYDGVDQDCDGNDDDRDGDGAPVDTDCDDLDPAVFPGAVEAWYDGIDQDCDGNDLDQDGDGENTFGDCDDTDPSAFPGATETWYDGVDQDCDGNDDDQDGDGFGRDSGGGGTGGLDCDDADPTVSPAAAEVWYDGADQDCDGNDDDQDGDTFLVGADCDDTDAAVNPAAAEVWYDGVDQDCAGDDDADQDADGHASLATGAGDDCDDTTNTVSPSIPERWYDGIDQDCDGNDDDQDGDGVPVAEDCDDTAASVGPGAVETWYDGVDQDCDGADDDQDGDGALVVDDCDDTDPTVVRCLQRIDGGCNVAGGGPGWMLALLAAGLLRSRRAAPLLLLATPAWALDATGTGRAPLDEGGLAKVAGMAARDGGTLDVALAGGWAGTTAEAVYDDGSEAPLMSGLTTLQLGVGWTFLDGLRIEAGLPVMLGAVVPAEMGPGVGDAWAAVHWAVLRRDKWAFGPVVEVALPTGDAERLSGGGGVGGALLVGASGRSGRVRWSGEVGGGARAAGRYDRLSFTPEPELRVGGGARVGIFGPLSVGAEVVGRFGLGADNAVALATSGGEVMLSAGVDLTRVDLMVSGGAGLLDGVGTPDARVVLSVRSRLVDPRPRFADEDQDGVPDTTDRCADAREDDDGFQDEDGCPDDDDDADGLLDAQDRCPSDPEDRDYVRDDDGCPDLDDDEDGLPDTVDRCPRDAGPPETNGCPDRDFDGLLDAADACPDDGAVPGTDLAHTDGCPAAVVVFPDRLHVVDPIPFDPGRATLRPDGADVVRQVALVLKRYPDLPPVEIGVHVDDAGDDGVNLTLTRARAEVVMKALEAAGVAPERLVPMGYGELRPMAPNDTEVDRARNRRVEFVFVGR